MIYKGWIPTVSERLSYSFIGESTHPGPTTSRNVADQCSRLIISCQHRPDLLDSAIPFLKSLLARLFSGIISDFWFICIAKCDNEDVHAPLKGTLYPTVAKTSRFAAHYGNESQLTERALRAVTAVVSAIIRSHQRCDRETLRKTRFEPAMLARDALLSNFLCNTGVYLIEDAKTWKRSIRHAIQEIFKKLDDFSKPKNNNSDVALDAYLKENGIDEQIKNLERQSLYSAQFSLERNGVVAMFPSPCTATEEPSADTESCCKDNHENSQDEVYTQLFYFLKDIAHIHQHHRPTTDTLSRLYLKLSGESDLAWINQTLKTLYSKVLEYKRNRHGDDYPSTLGLLAYVDAFVKIAKKSLADKEHKNLVLRNHDTLPHCCKNFTLRSPLRERIPAYREGSACCHGCGIRDYPIAPAVRSGNVAQNALRACYAGTRRAFVKFFMQHWGLKASIHASQLDHQADASRRAKYFDLMRSSFFSIVVVLIAAAGLGNIIRDDIMINIPAPDEFNLIKFLANAAINYPFELLLVVLAIVIALPRVRVSDKFHFGGILSFRWVKDIVIIFIVFAKTRLSAAILSILFALLILGLSIYLNGT